MVGISGRQKGHLACWATPNGMYILELWRYIIMCIMYDYI